MPYESKDCTLKHQSAALSLDQALGRKAIAAMA